MKNLKKRGQGDRAPHSRLVGGYRGHATRDSRHVSGHAGHVASVSHRDMHRESPKLFLRRPLITMRGPTLSSLDGEVELLREET